MKPSPQIVTYVKIDGFRGEKSIPVNSNTSRCRSRIDPKILWIAWTIFFTLIVGRQLANATSIIGFRTPTQVIIAGDGLRGNEDSGGSITSQTTACKIYIDPHRVYFAAGGVSFSIGDRRVSSEELLRHARFIGATIPERVRDAIGELHLQLVRAWTGVHQTNPRFFSAVISGHATHVIFGWTDNQRVGAASYSAIPLPDGSSTPAQSAIYPNRDVPPDTPFVWMVGGASTKFMTERLNSISNGTMKLPTNLPEFARQLIQVEIDADVAAHPDGTRRSVGPPIDVLVIEAEGAHWYERDPKSKCPNLP